MNTRIILLSFFLSLIISAKAQKKDTITDDIDDYIQQATTNEYLVVAGTSKNFHSLEYFAKDLSKKTGVNYDDMGRIYKDSCLVWPDDIDDEIYRGCYVFRRWEYNAISVELDINGVCFVPSEKKDRPKMIIVAGMYGNKKEATERLALIKKFVPTAYLLKKEVYMGCMH